MYFNLGLPPITNVLVLSRFQESDSLVKYNFWNMTISIQNKILPHISKITVMCF
jgi:hypothetical protein